MFLKYFIYQIIIASFISEVYSQPRLSLEELMTLRGKNYEKVDNYIVEKGWFYEGLEEEKGYYEMDWVYYVEMDFQYIPVARLYLYDFYNEDNMIHYQNIDLGYWDFFKDQAENYGFKLIETEKEEDIKKYRFESENYVALITIDNNHNPPFFPNSLMLKLMTKDSYSKYHSSK